MLVHEFNGIGQVRCDADSQYSPVLALKLHGTVSLPCSPSSKVVVVLVVVVGVVLVMGE